MSARLSIAVGWAWLCAKLLPVASRRAYAAAASWPERWDYLRDLRERWRLAWTDEQMERALAKVGAVKGGAR